MCVCACVCVRESLFVSYGSYPGVFTWCGLLAVTSLLTPDMDLVWLLSSFLSLSPLVTAILADD